MVNNINTTKVKIMQVNNTLFKANPKDYHKFSNIKYNRDTVRKHIDNLVDSIKECNLLEINPVIVEKNRARFHVFDGQNRIEAAKKLRIPFYYIEAKDLPSNTMIYLNTNNKNWTLKDFTKYWAKQEGTSKIYSEFAEIKESYNISYQVLIAIYNKKQRRVHNLDTLFRKGELQLVDKDYRNKKLSQLKELDEAPYERHLQLVTRKRQTFQESLLTCLEDPTFSYSKFKTNILKNNNYLNEFIKIVDLIEEMYRVEGL
jgi:hypothetical protein